MKPLAQGPLSMLAGLLLLAYVIPGAKEGVRVCAGADGVVRIAQADTCRPGENEYLLAQVEDEIDMGKEVGEVDTETKIADLERRVDFLTARVSNLERSAPASGPAPDAQLGRRVDALDQRVSSLEAAPRRTRGGGADPGRRVVAPFEVVDEAGKTIFAVRASPRGFSLSTASGKQVVFASALETGGFVKAMSLDWSLETVMGVNGRMAAFTTRQDGTPRATLAIAPDGRSSLEIANDNGTNIAALTVGTSGGGYLQIGDAAGNAMVEAGVTAAGVGLVRAYPHGGNAGVAVIGMPGTFIMGRLP